MKKIKFLSLLFIFTVMLFLLTDLYLVLLHPLEKSISPEDLSPDLLLVLGGGLKTQTEIGLSTTERLNLAIDLYKKKRAVILVSDGSLYRKSPAIAMMKNYLKNRGVREKDIVFEGKSQTTYENFLFTKEMISAFNPSSVAVCTSPYHQLRSATIIKSMRLDNYKIAAMKESEIYQSATIRQRLRNLRLIIREYFGILKFKFFKR